MEQYVYLLLTVSLAVIWAVIYFYRKDLRHKLFQVSLAGGLAGLLAEFWYYRDYWQPPTTLSGTVLSVEDFLFGAALTGIAATLYDFIFHKRDRRDPNYENRHRRSNRKLLALLITLGLLAILVFNQWWGVDSLLLSAIVFAIISLVIAYLRRDLLIPLLASAVLLVLIVLPLYLVLYSWMPAEYWASYGLIHDNILGVTVLNRIPLTELIWYFTFGSLGGIDWEFLTGERVISLPEDQQ